MNNAALALIAAIDQGKNVSAPEFAHLVEKAFPIALEYPAQVVKSTRHGGLLAVGAFRGQRHATWTGTRGDGFHPLQRGDAFQLLDDADDSVIVGIGKCLVALLAVVTAAVWLLPK